MSAPTSKERQVRVENAVTEAIYTVLADIPVYLATTAVKVKVKKRVDPKNKKKVGCTAACEIINYPDNGVIAKWSMEIDEMNKAFCPDYMIDSIREVMLVLEDEHQA